MFKIITSKKLRQLEQQRNEIEYLQRQNALYRSLLDEVKWFCQDNGYVLDYHVESVPRQGPWSGVRTVDRHWEIIKKNKYEL